MQPADLHLARQLIDEAARQRLAAQGGYKQAEKLEADFKRWFTRWCNTPYKPPRPLPEPRVPAPVVTPPEGERKPLRLTNSQIAEAAQLRRRGHTYQQIATRYGVHYSTIMFWLDERQRQAKDRRNQARTRARKAAA